MDNIQPHSLFLTSDWCSPASGHVGELGGRVDAHTYPAEGVCLFLVFAGWSAELYFSGLQDSAGLWEHRFVPRKKMLHSNLYSAVPESSLPPCPSTFYTFSLLCFSHSTSQGYTVLFVCLSSQCFSCWAVSSRRAEILFYSLLWPQHSEYLSNKYELNERLPGSGLQGLQASCHSIGP